MPATSAHDPRDQECAAAPDRTPSVRDLLAACAAARTVSTPPGERGPEAAAPAKPRDTGRDAA